MGLKRLVSNLSFFNCVCDAESGSGEVKGQRSQRSEVSGPR